MERYYMWGRIWQGALQISNFQDEISFINRISAIDSPKKLLDFRLIRPSFVILYTLTNLPSKHNLRIHRKSMTWANTCLNLYNHLHLGKKKVLILTKNYLFPLLNQDACTDRLNNDIYCIANLSIECKKGNVFALPSSFNLLGPHKESKPRKMG